MERTRTDEFRKDAVRITLTYGLYSAGISDAQKRAIVEG